MRRGKVGGGRLPLGVMTVGVIGVLKEPSRSGGPYDRRTKSFVTVDVEELYGDGTTAEVRTKTVFPGDVRQGFTGRLKPRVVRRLG